MTPCIPNPVKNPLSGLIIQAKAFISPGIFGLPVNIKKGGVTAGQTSGKLVLTWQISPLSYSEIIPATLPEGNSIQNFPFLKKKHRFIS